MSASIQIDVSTGAAETITANVSNLVLGSVDEAVFTGSDHPVVAGDNSFEKYFRVKTTLNDAIYLEDFRAFMVSGTLEVGATLNYGQVHIYAQPTNANSTIATQPIPTSEPASENLYISGASGNKLTSDGYTDYGVLQLKLDATAIKGSSVILRITYKEVA